VSSSPSREGSGSVGTRARVLLASDSPKLSGELLAGLERLPLVEIVGEANTSQEALTLFLEHRPRIVLLSVSLPDEGGFSLLRSIKRAAPGCAVILVTYGEEPFVRQAGFLLGATAVYSTNGAVWQICGIVDRLAKGWEI
jgi:DNA-binding NarL/FixJ family response regulator